MPPRRAATSAAAWAARSQELICKGTGWQLKTEGRKAGKHTWWAKDPTRRQALQTKYEEALTTR